MDRRKALIPIFLLVSMSSIAMASNHITLGEDSGGYDGDATIIYGQENNQFGFHCSGCGMLSGGTTYEAYMEIPGCGEIDLTRVAFDASGWTFTTKDNPKWPNEERSCSVGTYSPELKVWRSNCGFFGGASCRGEQGPVLTSTTGTLTIEPKNMDAHRGNFLFVELNANSGSERLRNFFLTDDGSTWDGNSQKPNSLDTGPNPSILVQETDWGTVDTADDYGKYIPQVGDIIERGTRIDSIGFNSITTHQNGWLNEDGLLAEDVAEFGFGAVDWNQGTGLVTGGASDMCTTDVFDFNSCSPVHRHGDYALQGDIIVGNEPEHHISGSPVGGGGPYIYICREGATMNSEIGETTQVVEDDDGNFYKCDDGDTSFTAPDGSSNVDGSTWDWDRVSECSDGLDNDNDANVDMSDPDCNDPSDISEDVGGGPCSGPPVAKLQSLGPFGSSILVAQYKDASGNCVTEPHSSWISSPTRATCYPYGFGITYCSPAEMGAYASASGGPGSVPVVRYYATRDYFEALAKARAKDLTTQGVSTSFVQDVNGWVSKKQTLYQAEMKYDGGGPFLSSSCQDCHNYTTWSNKDVKEPEVTNAYDNSNLADNGEAWVVANAGARNENVSSADPSGSIFSENTIFSGGFAGKCDSGEAWQYEGVPVNEWHCSGSLDFDQAVMLPEIQSGNTIGMVVMPFVAYDSWETLPSHVLSQYDSYSQAYDAAPHLSGSDSLDELQAWCWPGGSGDKPDFSTATEGTDYIQENVSVQKTAPFGVYGTVNMGGHSDHSCYWQYSTTSTSGTLKDEGNKPVELHTYSSGQAPRVNFTSAHSGLKGKYSTGTDFQNQVDSWMP